MAQVFISRRALVRQGLGWSEEGGETPAASVPTIHPSHTGGGFPLRLSFLTALFLTKKWHNFKAFMEDKVFEDMQ